ncbi:MAG: bifunctional YncE family protein/alkaline phosphatase family protein [Acidobacteria bacterium]|nr:bifunctional YncE family protein/alkaline phosphatase family protein [Acidobacteriota bacterium]MBW4044128.1 bifunctional YncE family protein/alkaline phosphatase family protein [Acidobacteriota bacterium]
MVFRSLAVFVMGAMLAGSSAVCAPTATDKPPSGVVLPNGRSITPTGNWTVLAPFAYAVAVRPDGTQLTVPSIGWPFSLNILDHPDSSGARVQQIPPGQTNNPAVRVHAGVAYSLDGRLLFDATGDDGRVAIYDTASWHQVASIQLDGATAGRTYSDSFAAALVLSGDGRTLYVLDQGNWRVVLIDTTSRKRIASVPTGVNPFTLALSPDGRHMYVANSGLFEYRPIPGVERAHLLTTGLHFPPFANLSPEAKNGTVAEGHQVPGLGNPNDARGSSLWTYNIADRLHPEVTARLRLGALITGSGKGVVGGASPSGLASDSQNVYVALAHEDAVAVVRGDGSALEQTIPLSPFTSHDLKDDSGRPLRGVIPAGMALSGDHLYVAEAGINAVAVIDTHKRQLLGQMPVGWFPSALAIAPDGRTLYVVNARGQGSGPNGSDAVREPAPGTYVGELEHGSLSTIQLPVSSTKLEEMTHAVIADNQAAVRPTEALPAVHHVFLIIRENRTFDEILGDLPNANGNPNLARYGMKGWTTEKPVLKGVAVTPNAHALAERFATSDNFFADSDVSADGHRWVVGIAPSPWLDLAWSSNYGGRRREDPASETPGRRALGGGADAPMPEDEPEYGSMWEHIASHHRTIFNYGEGLELEGGEEIDGSAPEGQRLVLNAPLPAPLFAHTDRRFPTFNLGIPDQFRYEEFRRDFSRKIAAGSVPSLVVIRLPVDHTASPRTADGYPYRASYVADNDLALGKIVDFLSHSRIWKDSAVFVTEDDAQGGVDHVDAHRSVLLVMGPSVRPGYVDHRHTSMSSILRTVYELLGTGPLNLEDGLSADLSTMFTRQLDLRPYNAVSADPRVFQPEKARIARPKTKEEAAELVDCDDPQDLNLSEARSRSRHAHSSKRKPSPAE